LLNRYQEKKVRNMGKEKIIGIDLGTSNSEAAVMIGGKPTIIPSAEGATVAGKMFLENDDRANSGGRQTG
jgi:molecular chaperone DnaK (HSP70)